MYPIMFGYSEKKDYSVYKERAISDVKLDGNVVEYCQHIPASTLSMNNSYDYSLYTFYVGILGDYSGKHTVTVIISENGVDKYVVTKEIDFCGTPSKTSFDPIIMPFENDINLRHQFSYYIEIIKDNETEIEKIELVDVYDEKNIAELAFNVDGVNVNYYCPEFGVLTHRDSTNPDIYGEFLLRNAGNFDGTYYNVSFSNSTYNSKYYLKVTTKDGKVYSYKDCIYRIEEGVEKDDASIPVTISSSAVAKYPSYYPVVAEIDDWNGSEYVTKEDRFYPFYIRFATKRDLEESSYRVKYVKIDGELVERDNVELDMISTSSYWGIYGSGDTENQVINLGLKLRGEYVGTKKVEVLLTQWDSTSGRNINKYLVSTDITFKEVSDVPFKPAIIDGTQSIDLEETYNYKSFTIGINEGIKKVAFVNAKREIELSYDDQLYINKYSYSPEYGELVVKSPVSSLLESSDRSPMGQYERVHFTISDVSIIPNGKYNLKITTESGKEYVFSEHIINVYNSEIGIEELGNLYGYSVPDAVLYQNGDCYFYALLYAPEFKSVSEFDFDAVISIDGKEYRPNWSDYHLNKGFLILMQNLCDQKLGSGTHTYSIKLNDIQDIVGSAKVEGTFKVVKNTESELECEQKQLISAAKGDSKTTVNMGIPYVFKQIEKDPIKAVYVVGKDNTSHKVIHSYEGSYFDRRPEYEDIEIDYKGETVAVDFTFEEYAQSGTDILFKIGSEVEPGDYDLKVVGKDGDIFLYKNAISVKGGSSIGHIYQSHAFEQYYCNPDSGYIAVTVYGNDAKLLAENVPVLYYDKELTKAATTYCVSRGAYNYGSVVYKLKLDDHFAVAENALLYATFGDDVMIDGSGAVEVETDEGTKKICAPFAYKASSVAKYFLSYGTNKMLRLYISDLYESQLEAANYLVELKAKVSKSATSTEFYSTVLMASKDEFGWYVESPAGSEFTTKVSGVNSTIEMRIGDSNCSFYSYGIPVNKVSNITTNGSWKLIDPFNMETLMEGTADKKLSDTDIEKYSKYPALTLEVTAPTLITDKNSENYGKAIDVTTVKSIQIASLLQDTIAYDLGGVPASNSNKTELYKNGTLELVAPVANPHYEFKGWFLDSKFTKPVTVLTGVGGKAITVYAKWENAEIDVFYQDIKKETVKWNESFEIKRDEFVPVGYEISAVYVDLLGENDVKLQTVQTDQNFIELSDIYAGNKKVDKIVISPDMDSKSRIEYNIIYDLNGIEFEYDNSGYDRTLYIPKSGELASYNVETDNEKLPKPAESYWPNGMAFAGWYKDAALTDGIEAINLGMHGGLRVYAKWIPAQFTLKFHDNAERYGAKLTSVKTIADMTLSTGEVVKLPANVYSIAPLSTDAGAKFTFRGWSTDEELKETSRIYADKELVCFSSDIVPEGENKVVNLYACYAKTNDSFNIHFEPGYPSYFDEALKGNSNIPADSTYAYGTVTKLPVPSIPGHDFAGWVNTATGKKVTSITAKDMGDIELAATWKERTYKVVVDRNGGTGKNYTWTVKFSDTYNYYDLKDVYTKDGYYYAGWELYAPNINGAQTSNLRSSVADLAKIDASFGQLKGGSKLTYKIKWSEQEYTLEFDTQGAEDIASTTYRYTTAKELPVPTKAGYTFLGWASDTEGKKIVAKYNSRAHSVVLPAKTFGIDKLYAVWEGNYSIILHSPDYMKEKTITGYKIGISKALPKTPFGAKYKQYMYSSQAVDYIFTGWKTDRTGNEVVYGDADIICLQDDSKLRLEDGKFVLDLYGQGVPASYIAPDNTIVNNEKCTVHFQSNHYPSTGNMANQVIVTGKSTKLSKNKFASPDAVFMGWSTDASSNEVEYKDGDLYCSTIGKYMYSHVYLYGVWEDTFTITFDKNSDDAVDGNNTTYDYKYGYSLDVVSINRLSSPTRDGYLFAGWYTDAVCKKAFKGITKKTSGDITLYAKWTPEKYIIRYYAGDDTTGKMKDQIATIGVETKLSKCAFKRAGYDFAGWLFAGDSVNTVKFDSMSEVEEACIDNVIVVHAMWSPHISTVTYKNVEFANNSYNSQDENSQTQFKSASGYELAPAARAGYAFGGWYKDAKFTKPITSIAPGKKSNTVVYAKWTKITQ